YAISERRVVPLAWRRNAGRRAAADAEASQFPAWIHPELERKLRLRERWHDAQAGEVQSDPIRPHARRIFRYLARQSNFFERYDAGVTRMPLEYRHPLLDLRLVEYCLSLPPQPWCVKKWILRAAMRDLLPDKIRLRPKTALAGYSGMKMLERPEAQWIDRFEATPGLRTYVERQSIPKIGASMDPDRTWRDLRPLTLNFWLQNLVHPPQNHTRPNP
ncbi:MAG: asparagine synthase-related protein, partial [Usitatibacter sp.]